METFFKGFTLEHMESVKNTDADELAKAAAKKSELPPNVFFHVIEDPSIKTVELEPQMINVIQGQDWQAPILAYLRHHYEPNNTIELTRMQQRVKAYHIIGDELYKTSVSTINPDIIIYFRLLHNQGGRFKIINIIGHVLLFMNSFLPYVLIAILIFLRSMANSAFRESIFCHCVASAGCLIILTSCLRFSLCHRNNSDSIYL
jgi:hypothetical protein